MTAKTTTKANTDAFAAIHCAAKGLHNLGAIGRTTMRAYDILCQGQTNPRCIFVA